ILATAIAPAFAMMHPHDGSGDAMLLPLEAGDEGQLLATLPAPKADGTSLRVIHAMRLTAGLGSNPLGLDRGWGSSGEVVRFRVAEGRVTAEERRFIPKVEIGPVIWEARIMILLYLGVGALIVAGWTAPLLYWIGPMFLAEPVMRFIRMTEHVGRPTIADMGVNTRTNVVSAPWRFLAWNMNYHAEHHFAASVPFHALGRLHERLKGHVYVEKHGYLSAHLDILGQLFGSRARLGDRPGPAE
ncbi:MAG: fatty acid desaturase, partial [Pseudomonadota bacterium]